MARASLISDSETSKPRPVIVHRQRHLPNDFFLERFEISSWAPMCDSLMFMWHRIAMTMTSASEELRHNVWGQAFSQSVDRTFCDRDKFTMVLLLRPLTLMALTLALVDQYKTIFQIDLAENEKASAVSLESMNRTRRHHPGPPGVFLASNGVNATDDEGDETSPRTKITTLDPAVPSNLRIAFMGDSVTRYQYVSLAHYLRTSTWIQDEDRPNVLTNTGLDGWQDFYNHSRNLIQDNCNCYRGPGKINLQKSYENRYFADTLNNNFLTFIRKMGKAETHGHWDPETVFSRDQPSMDVQQSNTSAPFQWRHSSWSNSIREHVAKLEPKPELLVFNAGLWKGHDLNDPNVLISIREALDESGIRGIYQTTTRRYVRGQRPSSNGGPPNHNNERFSHPRRHCFPSPL